MAATSNYQAGIETNSTQLAYGNETVWGVVPAVQFQNIRFTSESLQLNKTKQRPQEITSTREAAQPVTTQQSATGSIGYALSYGTHDEFMSVAFQSDWGAAVSIQSIGTDISIVQTAGVVTLTSTLAGKFTPIVQGQWIRMVGAVNAANNTMWYVSVKDSAVLLHLTGPNSATAVSETAAAANIGLRGGRLSNGTTFKSLWIQKRFSATLYNNYGGSYVSRMGVTGSIGNFMSGSIDIVSKSEAQAVTDSSTGAVLAAPTGRVLDPVAGWITATWNEIPIATAIDQFSLTWENTGAAPEYGMGSASAGGILGGTFQASGSFRAYFKDLTLYNIFTAETAGRFAVLVKDQSGSGYAFQFLSATLDTAQAPIAGPGQAIMQTFTVGGGPAAAGGTFTIDRMVGV